MQQQYMSLDRSWELKEDVCSIRRALTEDNFLELWENTVIWSPKMWVKDKEDLTTESWALTRAQLTEAAEQATQF